MVLQLITQALSHAEELKHRVLISNDLLQDNEALSARLQLQKVYERVLLLDLEYAINKKVEQDLWNIGFKNYIDALQKLVKNKESAKRNEYQGLLNVCLESASGFYLTLLEEICTTFSFSLPFPSYRKNSFLQSNANISQVANLIRQPKKSSCCYICQHCLVHLGDIARYKFRCKQAEIFYRNAIILSPSSGQPYNQLALLETSRGDKLATVFYYVRSISVRNPFPAAASNLSLTLKKANINIDWGSERNSLLSFTEFVILFLKIHALLHVGGDMLPCVNYVRLLSTSLTAHVATESFTSLNLIQMMIINMYAYDNISNKQENSTELPTDEKLAKTLIIELIAGSLNAFLLPVYTYKPEDSLAQYFALPAIKITLDWIRSHSDVLEDPGFVNRPQIWPAFCQLLNEVESPVEDFCAEKYKNATLPEDQDIQGFIPLANSTPEYRYSDSKLDLDSSNKLRICRIKNFALWLVNESNLSLIKISKTDSGRSRFNAIITGGQSSNELIIQQLEELLKNDSTLSQQESRSNKKTNNFVASGTKDKFPINVTSSPETLGTTCSSNVLTENNQNNKRRTGILKTQSFLDKKDKSSGNDNRKQSRQNVALQTILKRNQEQEHKQVTFKTPSPSLSICSDLQDSAPLTNHSQLWPTGPGSVANNNLPLPSLAPSPHSIFMNSFPNYSDSFRAVGSATTSSSGLMAQSQSINFTNEKNSSQYFSPNLNGSKMQSGFPAQIYQKPFIPLPNERLTINQFNNNGTLVNDERNQSYIEHNLLPQVSDNRHLQRNQFTGQANLNFLPPWKQDANSWWLEDKREILNPGVMDDSANSVFHYRNTMMPSHVSQPSGISFGHNGQLQFQSQQPPPPPPPPVPQPQQTVHQLRQMSQQPTQPSHLRPPNGSNNPVGAWPNSCKQSPALSNNTSLFNFPNKQLFDSSSSHNPNQTAVINSEEKIPFGSSHTFSNNTYSLFSPMWNSTTTTDSQLNQNAHNNPLAVLTSQSIWSEGVSPLQRLLEQQKKIRERPIYHNSQPPTND